MQSFCWSVERPKFLSSPSLAAARGAGGRSPRAGVWGVPKFLSSTSLAAGEIYAWLLYIAQRDKIQTNESV